ncbi:O-antigen polysaccharide polymerase Wzy [Caviibacter abscessus]|uniref:O-antigen polysaccharide polymerase Wzy n=1 Tax=Caviibacter abscessus TaxID=1766719 RepID=UPI00082E79C1|nr:O-antigen polysaccharide polymerase Wzy [Caviibacter abscessus]
MTKKQSLYGHIIVIILSILVFNLFSEIKHLELLVSAVYIYTLIHTKYYLSFLNVYMIFLYTLGLFNFSRMFLDLLGHSSFGWATKFANYYFTESVKIEILHVFLLVILFVQLGFLIFVNTNDIKFNFTISRNERVIKISKLIFLISMPMLVIKLLIQFRYILSLGYSAYYTGVLKNIEYPIYTMGSGTLMTIAFILFLTAIPTKNEFKIYSTIYLLVKFVDSLKGARAIFLTQLLFILWLYKRQYGIKINFKYMLKLFSFVAIFSQILVNFREKTIFSFKLIQGFLDFLFSQGVSYLVLGYTIDIHEKIPNKPYILQGLFGFKGQGFEALNTTNSLADVLTYNLDKVSYLKGEGIGSSFIAESYLLGYVAMILIFILLGYFITYYETKVGQNRYLLMLSVYIVPNIFYIPRGSLFGGGLLMFLLTYSIIYIIFYKVVYKNGNNT